MLPVEGVLEATALLQQAGEGREREELEGKSTLIVSEVIHITAQQPPSAPATSAHYDRRPETPSKFH